MICCKSYQDIPDDPRDNYMDSEDYFDLFLTEFYKRNGIKNLSDDNYETVRRWWYEFVCGRDEEWDYGCDMTLEEMFAELKEYDENREKHTCKTCERKRDDVFCLRCRTGCNDDYTLSDYWHSYTRVEKLLWGRIAQLQDDKKELKKEIAELKEKYVKNICDCDICDTYCNSQLIKAKEIIKKFSEFVNNEIEYDPEHPQEHTDLWNKLCEEAEQFLKW